MVLKGAAKHLNEIGIAAARQKNLVAQLAKLTPSNTNYFPTLGQLLDARNAGRLAQKQAVKWAKAQYREAAKEVIVDALSQSTVGTVHYVSFGEGIRAEYDRMVEKHPTKLSGIS